MKFTLISIFSSILLCLILHGCENKVYNNKAKYEINVNETVEIYYTTNSCCYYCVSNEKELMHIKLIERKLIEAEPNDCIGCNHTSAFIFIGQSKGIDTIEVKGLGVTMNCDSNNVPPEKYIIEIK